MPPHTTDTAKVMSTTPSTAPNGNNTNNCLTVICQNGGLFLLTKATSLVTLVANSVLALLLLHLILLIIASFRATRIIG